MVDYQMNKMVLFDANDDQQVPQAFNYVNGSSGGTVFEPNKLPDFDCLLQGLTTNKCEELVTAATTLETLQTLTDLDTMNDDLQFYDESFRFKTEVIKQEKYLTGCDMPLPSPQSEEEQRQSQFVMDEVQKEINYACSLLEIPSDPYMWTLEQAQKWVLWTLDQFKLPLEHHEHFLLDGTSLCMLSEDDFRLRSHMIGPYLYAQLEIWKNARNLLRAPPMDDYTLTDLDSVQRAPIIPHLSAIPTSVIMPTPTLSPTPSTESLDSSGSSGGGWGPMSHDHMVQDRRTCMESPTVTPTRAHYPHMRQNTIHLWQFLKELLMEPHSYSSCIRWLDRSKGVFKIEDSARVAKLWGQRKNRPAMNYDKLSRSIRQYYKKGIIKKTEHSKRLVYQFCPQYML